RHGGYARWRRAQAPAADDPAGAANLPRRDAARSGVRARVAQARRRRAEQPRRSVALLGHRSRSERRRRRWEWVLRRRHDRRDHDSPDHGAAEGASAGVVRPPVERLLARRRHPHPRRRGRQRVPVHRQRRQTAAIRLSAGPWANWYLERNRAGLFHEVRGYHALSLIADLNQAWGSLQWIGQVNHFLDDSNRFRLRGCSTEKSSNLEATSPCDLPFACLRAPHLPGFAGRIRATCQTRSGPYFKTWYHL